MGTSWTSRVEKLLLSLAIFVLLIISPDIVGSLINYANAVPSGPYNLGYVFDIEKTLYNPGDTVVITISNEYLQNPQATVTIKNGMGSENFENAQTFYREEKNIDNGTAEYKYQIPASGGFMTEPVYRYYVEVSGRGQDGSQYVIGRAFFFTNEEASKIVISDFVADETKARPGGVLTFSAKITDGLGKPLPTSAYMEGKIAFPSDDCNMDYTGMSDNVSPNAKGVDYLSQYKSYGKIYGWINVIPELSPGDYDLILVAYGGEDKGFQYAEKHLKIHVSGSTQDVNVIDVFKMELRSTEPGVKLSNGNHEADIIAGKDSVLYLDGFSAINICGGILADYPLQARLLQTDPLIAPKPDQESIEHYDLRTNETGGFVIPLNFTGFSPGQYTILVDMTYRGVLYERGSIIHVHDVKDYPIHENGQDFIVHVDAGYSSLQNFTFDKAQKQITILVSSSNSSYNRMEISVPYGLLSGNFSVLINGRERMSDDSLSFGNGPNGTEFRIISYGENISRIDLIGTNVVPEFGSPIGLVVIIGMALSIAYWRKHCFSR